MWQRLCLQTAFILGWNSAVREQSGRQLLGPFTPEGSEGRQPAGRVGDTRLGNEYSERKRFKQITVVLKIKTAGHRTQLMQLLSQLTSLCSLSSLYLTGCSGLASMSGPGLRQLSHLQPWWGGAKRHACSRNVTLCAQRHGKNPTIPPVLQSRCRCR